MKTSFRAQRKKRALMQFAGNAGPDQHSNAQADQDLRCPFTVSIDNVVYVNEQRMTRSDCTDAHAHLDRHCSLMAFGSFVTLRILC